MSNRYRPYVQSLEETVFLPFKKESRPHIPRPKLVRRKKMGDAEVEDVVLLYSRGGVTMQDLADKHGASLSYVSRIINGSRLAHRHTRTKLGKEGYEDKLNSV